MRWIWILRNRVWPEVRQTWPSFLFFAGPAVAYLLAVLAGRLLNRDAADQVRYFGTWLQLFGIVLVAQGVRERRREFNRPTVFAAMRARTQAIVHSFKAQHHVAVTGVGAVGLAGSAALAYGRVRGTIEQRLDGLEREKKSQDKLCAWRLAGCGRAVRAKQHWPQDMTTKRQNAEFPEQADENRRI
jgi:hypothetical protein